MESRYPNLFIVGMAKSATTSLYNALRQHPDIYFPEKKFFPEYTYSLKEPRYFSHKYCVYPHRGPDDIKVIDERTIKDLKTYLYFFSKSNKEKYLGDASADNLYYYKTAEDIYKYNNKAKIIISLRNPIERTFSAYAHMRRYFREKLSFEKALAMEEKRLNKNYEFLWGYKKGSLYYEAVKHYIDIFGKDNVFIILFDDIKNDFECVLKQTCKFLEIDDYTFYGIEKVHNKSDIPKKNIKTFLYYYLFVKPGLLHRIVKKYMPLRIKRAIKNNCYTKQIEVYQIKERTRKYLLSYFKEDILKLEALIDRDLSSWLVN